MIGHKAVRQDPDARLGTVILQTVQIGLAVCIGVENFLVCYPALRDVVRDADGDSTWKSGHLLKKSGDRQISLSGPYLSVPEVELSWEVCKFKR